MLYTYPELDEAEIRVCALIERMRHDLRHFVVQEPGRWSGLLARMTRARALRASNSIEGINVSQEDAIAAVDGEDPADADRPTWRAVTGYQAAMTYILQRCKNNDFRFSVDGLLAVHFMISQHDLGANPGNFRRGWVGVRNSSTGEVVHEGVDRSQLEGLIAELVHFLNASDMSPSRTLIRAALAHLNLTLMHPFSDGNGRTARCFQTAVLANEGIVAPEFSSIEEYIGRNQQDYYDVLAETGGGGWNPVRNCKNWIRFCLLGHYRQLQTLLRRNEEVGKVYEELAGVLRRRGLPERMALALLEAAFGGRVRNASYRVSAEVTGNLASRDLKQLVDTGLLKAEGEKRGRHYVAGDEVRVIRAAKRMTRQLDDPFAAVVGDGQGTLPLSQSAP